MSGERGDSRLPENDLFQVQLGWAKHEQAREIFELERALNPRKIHAEAERREIWKAMLQARTHGALLKACEAWDQLPDVRRARMCCFPAHILANEKHFFFMKRNRRFPRSDYGDEGRLEYLSRGMAGVMVGVSPMTAIERLRNMKHEPGGPLWVEKVCRVDDGKTREGLLLEQNEQHCACWRCRVASKEWETIAVLAYENGLKLFIEVVAQVIKQRRNS